MHVNSMVTLSDITIMFAGLWLESGMSGLPLQYLLVARYAGGVPDAGRHYRFYRLAAAATDRSAAGKTDVAAISAPTAVQQHFDTH